MSSQKAINSGGENIALTLKSNQHQVSITQSINGEAKQSMNLF